MIFQFLVNPVSVQNFIKFSLCNVILPSQAIMKRLEIVIFKNPGPRFWVLFLDLGRKKEKTQAQKKPRKLKKCLGPDSWYRKNSGLGPGPARSLEAAKEKYLCVFITIPLPSDFARKEHELLELT